MTARFITLTVVLAIIALTTNAQDNNPRIVSGLLLGKASKLYDSGQYKKAIAVDEQIDRNDTNYITALDGISACYYKDSAYATSTAYARKALSLSDNFDLQQNLYNQIGNNLLAQDSGEAAIRVYDSAIRKFPSYALLYLNKGSALIGLHRWAEAESVFKQAMLLNPYLYSCHFKLGYCALQQGKLIPAVLCFTGYLLVDPEGEYRVNCINWLNLIAHNSDTLQNFLNGRKEDQDENYQLLEQILQSKIALDKNYKPLLQLDDPISRQIQVLLEKIQYQPGDSDFYMQFYVPWFKAAYTNNQFEPFINRMFSSINIPLIQEYIKKHKKEVDQVNSGATEYLDLIRGTRELNYSKRNADTLDWTFDDNGFTGHGIYAKRDDKLLGPWLFLYGPGNTKGKGFYNANGKKEGDFTWYFFDGQIKGKEFYSDGKQEGEETYYFSNGQPSSHSWYKNGDLDGESTDYFWIGTPNTITHYQAGKEDGIKISFYANGDTSLMEHYTAGVLNGESRGWSKYKTLESVSNYKNGHLDGDYRKYYPNGHLSDSGAYMVGKQEGEWKSWFANGQLKHVDHYLHDMEDGERTEYFENGTLSQTYTSKSGKIIGEVKQYDDDAKLYAILTYSNGTLMRARYFDKTGKQIGESLADHKAITLVRYHPDGAKRSETPYDAKGGITGTQTFYNENGSVMETDVYQDDTEQGPSTSWFLNGKKRVETPYVDGEMDGYHRTWYSNGQIREEGWYSQGKAQGYWLYHDEMGTLTDSAYYLDDDLEGYKSTFYPNGKRSFEIKYHRGWMEESIDYDTSGKELSRSIFKAGTGMLRLTYPNGQVETEGAYVGTEKSGTHREWYFDGKPLSVTHYTRGMQDSVFTSWNRDGSISSRGTYAFGEKTGLWKYYFHTGALSETEEYVRGDLEGANTFYDQNGKVKLVTQYRNGIKEGPSKEYAPDGTLAYQINYQDDDAVSYTYLDAHDSLVPAIPLPLHSGKVKTFYPNGQVSATFEYLEGYIHGDVRIYYPNGQLWVSNHEEYGNLEGPDLLYFPNGKINESRNYLHDNLHGLYRLYNDKGILLLEETYYNGSLEGLAKKFDDDGKPTETDCYFYGTLLSAKK
jgi:antitoxin component YwqK of YwqJK toxin-antitoxin module/tetratricopeptide (TPR) repeat protein